MAQQLRITAVKLTDGELVERWLAFAKELGVANVFFRIGNEDVVHALPVENPATHSDYKAIAAFIDVGAANLDAGAGVSHHSVRYTRNRPFDEIIIDIPSQHKDMVKLAQITGGIKKHFRSVDLNASLTDLFNDDLKRYYQTREATLIRLEQLSEKLIKDNESYRLRLDQHHDEYRKSLDDEYGQKNEVLDKRQEALDKREQEMDLADAKSTRRKLRQHILEKLAPKRALNVGIRKTWPIHLVFLVASGVLLVLGIGVVTSPGFDPLQVAHAVKLGLSSAAFLGTLMFYYRWMDAWIRRDVDEELRLRQLGIDVDRATWVVEVLSELKSETEKPIPDEVLVAITRGLFTGRDNTKAVTHPVEDVLAALLGSSREIEIDFPGGKVRADGRAVRRASRKADD